MKRMQRFLILMLALAMLTGCAAGTAPEEPTATPAASAPAPEDGTAPPAPTIEVAAESSAPDPWALWDGDRLFYVGNDGLHRREGEQDTVVDAGESRQYLGLYKLEDGRLLWIKRLTYAQEQALAAELPAWMFSHDSDAGVYDLFLADAQGENAQPLAESVSNLLFVSETQLVCVGMRADRPLLLVDLAAGSVQEIEGVDLSNQLLTQCFVADGVYYFYALEAEQDEQGAQGYALDLAAHTVEPFSGEAPLADAETYAPAGLPQAQCSVSGEIPEQTYSYSAGGADLRAVLRMDMDLGAAVITFLMDEEPVSLLEVQSVYSFYDYDEVQAAGEEAFILAHQSEDGVYYAAYVEQLRLSFAGGWAFVYEAGAADGAASGPERLVCAVPFAA